MIAWVEGVLREKAPTRVVVDVRGVGYELWIPLCTFTALPDDGKTVALFVHTAVREDAIQLFGFATATERAVFELLLKASRVGPKLAQSILSGLPPLRLLEALRSGQVTTLKAAPGVGPKLAERLCVELRDRAAELLAESSQTAVEAGGPVADQRDEVVSALVNLGYARPQAEKLAEATAREVGEDESLESWIRIALRRLAP